MDNPKRARSEKPRKQPRECAYVRSPDLQSALERIRQVACRDKGNGKFIVLRQTMRKRLQSKLREIKIELKRRLHHPVPEVGQWLRSVMQGHFNYYAVPRNQRKLGAFKYQVYRLWLRTLRQRSQRHRMTGGAHEPFGRPLVSTYSYFAPVPRTATARHDLR